MTTRSNSITVEVLERDEVVVLALAGSLCDDSIAIARRALFDAIDDDPGRLAVDLSRTDYISSAGVGMLVSVLKQCHDKGASLGLCGLNEDLRELFSITCLDQIFTLAPDVDSWCRSL
ncbi:MAG: STAS domain-containing protein [Planctomycetota bacterium]